MTKCKLYRYNIKGKMTGNQRLSPIPHLRYSNFGNQHYSHGLKFVFPGPQDYVCRIDNDPLRVAEPSDVIQSFTLESVCRVRTIYMHAFMLCSDNISSNKSRCTADNQVKSSQVRGRTSFQQFCYLNDVLLASFRSLAIFQVPIPLLNPRPHHRRRGEDSSSLMSVYNPQN